MEVKKLIYKPQAIFTAQQKRYLKVKRVADFVLALVMLIILFPIMLIAAIWVKCESKGPVIFKQRRPGYHQEIFSMYKFRSMRVDTRDAKGNPLTDNERLTRSGAFLRKTSIDELPQLVNILKGQMSWIGPRPFLINDLGTYNEKQLIRFDVLPGITSWTAIHGRNNQTIQEKYNHEIFYVENISFMLDIQILFKTITLVLSQRDVEDCTTEGRLGAEIIEDSGEE